MDFYNMGLDITVHKFIKPEDVQEKDKKSVLYVTTDFPEFTKEFQTTRQIEKLDFDKYKEKTGIDLLKLIPGKCYIDQNKHWHFIYNGLIEPLDVDMYYFPRKTITENVIYYKEVGYQRRGVNKQFYDDCNSKIVKSMIWTKDELLDFMEKYCDDTKYYDGPETKREHFQKNIINNFKEGKCVVTLL